MLTGMVGVRSALLFVSARIVFVDAPVDPRRREEDGFWGSFGNAIFMDVRA